MIPRVREGIRPLIADLGQTSQFLAHRGIVLSNAARELFLDRVVSDLLAALVLLEGRARGDYSADDRHDTTPPFAPSEQAKPSGLTPRQLFEAWVTAREPAQSSVESWRPVFNALTSYFPDRDVGSLSDDEAYKAG